MRSFPLISMILLLALPHAGKATANRAIFPLLITPNAGQFAKDVDAALTTPEMTVLFRSREVVYLFPDGHRRQIKVDYPGSALVHAEGLERADGSLNFFLGPNRDTWREDVPAYSSVVYRDMWPGIDVVYSVAGGHLKTEFQLAPNADASAVSWEITGAESVTRSRDGALVIIAEGNDLREAPPQVFEQKGTTGELAPVSGSFRLLTSNKVGISVGPYDHRNRLIFDPVISFSTYLGGSGQSAATAVAVDGEGNSIVVGYTTSFDLSSKATSLGSEQRQSAFVAKFNAAGNQLIFCTYLGGTLQSEASAVALDRWNNIYVAGATTASTFPVLRAVHPHLSGKQDAFVAELNSFGNGLVFSTYLGGTGDEAAYGVAVNRQGNVYVAGDTDSTNFPVVNALQRSNAGGQDAFIVKLGIGGLNVMWATYMGGSQDEHAAALAVDSSGAAVIAGSTESANLPVFNAFEPQSGGNQDAFITKINNAGNAFVFSTYLGGSGGTPGLTEGAAGVALDSTDAIYVAGTTSSSNFPTSAGAFLMTSPGGILDAFVTKFNSAGTPIYSTLVGGSSADYGTAIAVDVAGNAHIAGYTASSDFPSLRSVQTSLDGTYDAFVTKLNSTGTALIYSTLIGGSQSDSAAGIAIDRFANVILAGQTMSTDLPNVSAYQTTANGAGAAFVTRLPIGWKAVTFNSSAVWSIDALHNGGTNGVAPFEETISSFGEPGDIPIMGDWIGTGHQNLGVFRNGTWYLDIDGNGFWNPGDRSFVFGQAGDIPVVGDWNGSGTIKAGLYRKGQFILDFSGHLSGVPTGHADATFSFGLATDIPVAADWSGSGTAKVGVFRNGTWLLDWNGSEKVNGPQITFGEAGDIPVTGDWDGSGTVKIGVYRAGTFLLDYNGNGSLDAYGDLSIAFGTVSPHAIMSY